MYATFSTANAPPIHWSLAKDCPDEARKGRSCAKCCAPWPRPTPASPRRADSKTASTPRSFSGRLPAPEAQVLRAGLAAGAARGCAGGGGRSAFARGWPGLFGVLKWTTRASSASLAGRRFAPAFARPSARARGSGWSTPATTAGGARPAADGGAQKGEPGAGIRRWWHGGLNDVPPRTPAPWGWTAWRDRRQRLEHGTQMQFLGGEARAACSRRSDRRKVRATSKR